MGGTVHRMDPRTHKVNNHGNQRYKTNQEVRKEGLDIQVGGLTLLWMINLATRVHPELPLIYRMASFDGGYLDNRLWVQAMSTVCYINEEHRGNIQSGPDENILWRMI